jgi:uncharacterized protein YhaN
MRITELDIEGYGVWSGLRVEKLSDGMNVLYGPNEAGKTTLLQFVRTMLYGFSPGRRRYLPPVHGGRPGGVLHLTSPHGRFEIGRYDNSLPDGTPGEQLTLTAPDGTRQGEHFIKVLLANVDEPVFNNVFAIGLREIQELATLSDTEAAELLYSLSAGLDRVSLVEVLRELEGSRNRILDAAGKRCQVLQLLEEQEKLRAEIEELGAINHRWGHLLAERDQLQQEVTRLEEDSNRAEHLSRVMDLAVGLRDRWAQRAALDEQLAALGPLRPMPEGAIERLDAINARVERHQKRLNHLAGLREAAKTEFAGLSVNEALWRQAMRIEALKEQEPWIAQLRGQIGELHNEIGQSESSLAAEWQQLGLKSQPDAWPSLSAKMVAAVRASAKRLQQSRRQRAELEQAVATAHETVQSLTKQIQTALSAHGQDDLATAMDRAGGLVSQLRRRAQLDERFDQLARYQTELEERSRRLVERELPPTGVLVGLGVAFVVGTVLLLGGLFLFNWPMALLGLAWVAATSVTKVTLKRSNARQLEACHKQLGVLQLQVQQTKDDREQLDSQLPRGGESLAVRLQRAEKNLAALEELTPLDARRSTACQEAETAARRAEEAKAECVQARRRWRDTLEAAGLPEDLSPQNVHRIVQRGDGIAESQRRIAERREELQRRQRELDSLVARIAQLATEANASLASSDPIEQLHELAEAAARQEAAATRRDALRGKARQIRAARAKHEEAVSALKHRRRELFLDAGVKDEQEFRQRALQCARAEVLHRDRDAIAREIEAALASHCSEDAIRNQLEGPQAASLEARRDELGRRLAALQQQLRELLERRGRLSEQLAAITSDRRLATKRLDLAVVEKRLEEAIARWQVLAVTCHVLNAIRTIYEHERQPETLQEASGYLDRMTQGRYSRVWTPLGEHALRVDDSEGKSLPVEVLSRGTREQLFLSLRLALASSYARRGAPLPLVLDDVLVNFDSERAKAAAAVLRDFAAAGHQLLVFTCHEHILKLFASLKVPVSRLPSNAEPGRVVLESRDDEEKPKRQRQPQRSRRKAAAESDDRNEAKEPEADQARERPSRAKKRSASEGAFDADFYDAKGEEAGEDDEEEIEDDEPEADESLWDEEEEEQVEDLGDDSSAAA